jgi:hypothetical protein
MGPIFRASRVLGCCAANTRRKNLSARRTDAIIVMLSLVFADSALI